MAAGRPGRFRLPRALPLLVGAVLLLAAALMALGAALLQAAPNVAVQARPEPDDVARALALARSHDPRRGPAGQVRIAVLNARDLELLANHAAQRWVGGAARLQLGPQQAVTQFSLYLGSSPLGDLPSVRPWALPAWLTTAFGPWLNVELQWRASDPAASGWPRLDAARVGRLPVPAAWVERLALQGLRQAGLEPELAQLSEVVQHIGFQQDQLQVRYVWPRGQSQRLVGALLGAEELQRLRAHQQHLAALAQRQQPGWAMSLAPLMGPMFRFAQERSAAGGDAAAENRAAILVLTLMATGRPLSSVLPQAQGWPQPRSLRLLLGGRDDWTQHFLVSAALAAESTGPLSQAIGLYKELSDARGGSGFSFNDMAANRAGTRWGELAVRQPQRLQALMAAGVQESDFMPAAHDLPEFLPEPEFLRRYGGVGAPAYEAQMAEIERRVAALPVLR